MLTIVLQHTLSLSLSLTQTEVRMANQIDSIVTSTKDDSRSVAGYTSVNDWPPAILAHWPTDVLKRGLANPSNSYFTEPSMTDSLVDPAVIDWPSATVEQLIHLLHVQHLRLHALSHLCLVVFYIYHK